MTEELKAYCLTIHVVGALRVIDPEIGRKIGRLQERIGQAIMEEFPEFLPGNPPIWISHSELRDDWIKR